MVREFEFVDHLPPQNPPRGADATLRDQFVAALKARPGVWAKWPSVESTSFASNIRRGMIRHFRGGEFEAETRNGSVYVRYVGVPDGAA